MNFDHVRRNHGFSTSFSIIFLVETGGYPQKLYRTVGIRPWYSEVQKHVLVICPDLGMCLTKTQRALASTWPTSPSILLVCLSMGSTRHTLWRSIPKNTKFRFRNGWGGHLKLQFNLNKLEVPVGSRSCVTCHVCRFAGSYGLQPQWFVTRESLWKWGPWSLQAFGVQEVFRWRLIPDSFPLPPEFHRFVTMPALLIPNVTWICRIEVTRGGKP